MSTARGFLVIPGRTPPDSIAALVGDDDQAHAIIERLNRRRRAFGGADRYAALAVTVGKVEALDALFPLDIWFRC